MLLSTVIVCSKHQHWHPFLASNQHSRLDNCALKVRETHWVTKQSLKIVHECLTVHFIAINVRYIFHSETTVPVCPAVYYPPRLRAFVQILTLLFGVEVLCGLTLFSLHVWMICSVSCKMLLKDQALRKSGNSRPPGFKVTHSLVASCPTIPERPFYLPALWSTKADRQPQLPCSQAGQLRLKMESLSKMRFKFLQKLLLKENRNLPYTSRPL